LNITNIYNFNSIFRQPRANPLLVGKSASDKRDLKGKDFVEEFLSIAKKSGIGTASYSYKNPITGKEQRKTSFIMKVA
jgi:cytochrome c